MDKGGDGGPAANNSSDFVRKLYKMLEDPTYETIVRWGEGGDSFVVLENDKFTKHILPKHFKHSNFASFVRQLNKYDFHKVRQSNEDSAPSPYGPNAWEFKHPEFQANKKDSLDNIRRKAPAPRKSTQGIEEQIPAQQIDLVNSQSVATQQQLQQLSERYSDLTSTHTLLLQQVLQLQNFVKNHDGVMHRVVGFLQSLDAERHNSRSSAAAFANGTSDGIDEGTAAYHPASPLVKAEQLLDEISAESLPNKDLEQMTRAYSLRGESFTPTNDHIPSSSMTIKTENSTANLGFLPLGNDLDNMVYPVGHTNGIDPINSEHINNIPYALPSTTVLAVEPVPGIMPQTEPALDRKKSIESAWGGNKPLVLLVEDDPICARIGANFLQACDCGVSIANNGLEAVTYLNNPNNRVNIVLMDIIMPHLDGVSATVCIREFRGQSVPIIAMTSNIRADDIDVYFKYGMNDVLAKPFTKETMFRTLNKHLPQFKKGAQFSTSKPMSQPGFVKPDQSQAPLALNIGQLSAAPSIKDETSPGKSPATASSWHSPNQIPGASPIGSVSGNFIQPMRENAPYDLTPTHPHPQSGFPAPGGAPRVTHRRAMADMTSPDTPDDHPEKRQRMFPGSMSR